MKKITTLVALASIMILAATTTNAQDKTPTTTSQWSIGPKAGVNLTHFWGSDVNHDFSNPRVAEQFGAFVTWSNDRWYAVSGELLYSSKGSRYKYENFLGDYKTVTKVSYIEMPILFRAFLKRDGMVRPHLSAGPSLGFLVVANTKGVDPKTDATSFMSNANKVDVGMNFGGGVNIRVKKIWINPELRYNLGLISLAENSSVRNGALTLSVGVGFPISKGSMK